MSVLNADPAELDRFAGSASEWWDPNGVFRPLHAINPLRLRFIVEQMAIASPPQATAAGRVPPRTAWLPDEHVPADSLPADVLAGHRVLDVGCGGGILSEALAAHGAQVLGIDLADASLRVARLHGLESGITVDYRCVAVEALAEEKPAHFTLVTCMEMLEHVPDPTRVVRACARLAAPGGRVVFSTLSRNPRAWLQAILGAEYLLGLVPRGTHQYTRFIRPAELATLARAAGLDVMRLRGMGYDPWRKKYFLQHDTRVNYLMACAVPHSALPITPRPKLLFSDSAS